MSDEKEMTIEQRDQILKIAKKQYELLGCEFGQNGYELVELLAQSLHPDERRCLEIAIIAHNEYNEDNLTVEDFF